MTLRENVYLKFEAFMKISLFTDFLNTLVSTHTQTFCAVVEQTSES